MEMFSRVYLSLAILFGIFGVIEFVHWCSLGSISAGHLIIFIPAIFFHLLYLVSRKITSKFAHIVILLFLSTGIIGGFCVIVGKFFEVATTEVTDVQKYEDRLDEFGMEPNAELVSHFPRSIPPYAKDVRFSFRPHFLQGGTYIQLRFSAPPDVISRLHEKFSLKKTKSFLGGDVYTHVNHNTIDGMPTTNFYTSGLAEEYAFPEDYEIMVLDEVLKGEDRSQHDWTHFQSHGVVISKKRNEIVYWAESS